MMILSNGMIPGAIWLNKPPQALREAIMTASRNQLETFLLECRIIGEVSDQVTDAELMRMILDDKCPLHAADDGDIVLPIDPHELTLIWLMHAVPGWLNSLPTHRQTAAVCKAAIDRCPNAIKFVKQQTPELCMRAVKLQWAAIQYVKDQTPALCAAALKQSPHAARFIRRAKNEAFS